MFKRKPKPEPFTIKRIIILTKGERVMFKDHQPEPDKTYLDYLEGVARKDVAALHEAHKHYGDSCLKRGGVGLFMMFARKWDRLEKQAAAQGYDIFQAFAEDGREEGILDDIRDLRRYLLICEAQILKEFKGIDVTVTNEDMVGYVNQDPDLKVDRF